MLIEAPKNSGDLRPFKDHVWINVKSKWRRQLTIKACNRVASWELLTHPQYSKIRALERFEKENMKGESVVFSFDPSLGEWIQLGDDFNV